MRNRTIASCSLIFLLLFSVFAIFGQMNANAAVTSTFGSTTVGSLFNAISTDKDGARYQLTESGTVQSITQYFVTTGFQAKAAIYTDSNGVPGNLVVQSASETISSTGWHTFTISSTALSAGYYWLTILCSSGSTAGRMSASSTVQHVYRSCQYSSEFSSTFGNVNTEKTAPSIYATYTTSTATPTPTPTTYTGTFGATISGDLYNAISTDKDGARYQLTESGTVQSITQYFVTTGFQAKAAIYTDSNGVPGNLVVQSASETISSTGWHTFTISSTALSSGYYWLTILCSSSSAAGRMSASSTVQHVYRSCQYSSEFSSTFGNVNTEKTAPSIYATYTTSTATPTPTPTTTPPSTSSRLMGVDQFDINYINENNMRAMSNYGANAFRETIYMSDWTNTLFRNRMVEVSQWSTKYNMQMILGCMGTSHTPSEGFPQMLANAIYDSTARANWINTYGSMIRTIQPYGVNPINEVPVVTDTSYGSYISQAQFIADYKGFIIECIDAWSQIKPGLVFVVEGSPFYDISSMLSYPRIDQSRPSTTVYYSVHYHYQYYNENPYTTLSYYDTTLCSYWSGDLTTARSALFSNFLYNDGIKKARDLGLKVILEEVGANIKNPNVLAFEQDVFDFAEIYDVSVLWHSWGPSGSTGIGLLSNWTPTLNSMGTVWANNMP